MQRVKDLLIVGGFIVAACLVLLLTAGTDGVF